MPGNNIPQGECWAVPRWFPASRRQGFAVLAVTVFCLAVVAEPAWSAKQKPAKTKTVTGQVLDANENGIADAAVSVTDLQSGKKFTTVSKEDGRYQFAGLPPGHDFELQAVYKDASSEVRKISSLDSRLRVVVNFYIPPQAGD